ncbi:hypothetical protein IJU97_01235 [bacterium]|nr:hypothetical protein [bacterium]
MKRELGIDVSITKLILAATGALSEVLKKTENHENKESSDMQAEALAE